MLLVLYRPNNDQAIRITDSLFCEGRTKVDRSQPRKRLVCRFRQLSAMQSSSHGATIIPQGHALECVYSHVTLHSCRASLLSHVTVLQFCRNNTSKTLLFRSPTDFLPAVSLPPWNVTDKLSPWQQRFSLFIGYSRLAINRVSGSTALAIVM